MAAYRTLLLGWALLIAASPCWAQQPIRWETNLDRALQQASATNRLVLVHFWAEWCGPCQKMESQVFNQPGFGQTLSSQFVAVKINCDQQPQLAQRYKVMKYPSDLVLNAQGQLLFRQEGAKSATDYVSSMTQIAHQVRDTNVAARPMVPQVGTISSQLPAATPAVPVSRTLAPNPIPAGPPPNTQSSAATVDSRYDYYFNRGQQPSTPAAASPGSPPMPPQSSPLGATVPAVASPSTAIKPIEASPTEIRNPYSITATAPARTPTPSRSAAEIAATERPVVTQAQLPPGSPPLALDGYCPVSLLSEKSAWVAGDVTWGAVHRGRTYLFAGQAEQQQFLRNPDHYAPVLSGMDPVISLNQGQSVPGRRELGVFVKDGNHRRVVLFAHEQSRKEFGDNQDRYMAEVISAMR